MTARTTTTGAAIVVYRLAGARRAMPLMDAKQRLVYRAVEVIGPQHHAKPCKVMATPFAPAIAATESRRHLGSELLVFQPDTVLGVRFNSLATADVPPSASIKSATVSMPSLIRKL